jgi:hypothetical protein
MTDYAGVLTDLRSRRDAVQRELMELDTAIGAIDRLASIAIGSNAAASMKGPGTVATAYKGMTMPQALEAFLSLSPQPIVTTRQAINGLIAGGVKNGKGIRGHVYSTLHRLSQNGGKFRKHDDGRWSLRARTANDQEQPGESAARH